MRWDRERKEKGRGEREREMVGDRVKETENRLEEKSERRQRREKAGTDSATPQARKHAHTRAHTHTHSFTPCCLCVIRSNRETKVTAFLFYISILYLAGHRHAVSLGQDSVGHLHLKEGGPSFEDGQVVYWSERIAGFKGS